MTNTKEWPTFGEWISSRLKRIKSLIAIPTISSFLIAILAIIPKDAYLAPFMLSHESAKLCVYIINMLLLVSFFMFFISFNGHVHIEKLEEGFKELFTKGRIKFYKKRDPKQIPIHIKNAIKAYEIIVSNIIVIIVTSFILYLFLILNHYHIFGANNATEENKYTPLLFVILNISTIYFVGKAYLALYFDVERSHFRNLSIVLKIFLLGIVACYFIAIESNIANSKLIFYLISGVIMGLSMLLLINELDSIFVKIETRYLISIYLYAFIQPCIFIYAIKETEIYQIALVTIAIPLKVMFLSFLYFATSKGGIAATQLYNSIHVENSKDDIAEIFRIIEDSK